MMQELVNQDSKSVAEKGAAARRLFKRLNLLICFIWIAGISWMLSRYASDLNKVLLPSLLLTIVAIPTLIILTRIAHTSSYAQTQQVFTGGSDFYVYYVEDAGSDKNNRRYYQPSFFLIPHDAKITKSPGKFTFRGNIRQVLLPLSSDRQAMSLDDAKLTAKESGLTFFKTSRPCRSVVLNRIYNAAQEEEMLDAFYHPQAGQTEEALYSWRVLLDQYMKEKSENLEIADTATQSTWYADHLAKRRQKKLGISVRETYTSRGKLHETYVGDWNDGRNTRTIVHTNGFRKRIYSMAGELMEIKKKYTCAFSILTSKSQKDSYICPNCGAESKSDELMEYCQFCGTKFNLTSYDMKLSGVQYDPLRTSSALIVIGPLLLLALAVFVYSYSAGNHQDLSALVLDSIFRSAIFSIYLIPVLLIAWGVFTIIKRMKATQINVLGGMIRKSDPDFSCEEFEGIINARLKGFFLADTDDNIRCFTNLQTGSLSSLADVEVLAYRRPRGLMVDNAFRVDVILEMIYVAGGKLVRKEEPYTIDLYREPTLKTKLLSDQEIYTCPSCAGSLSILNGGVCAHCGNVMDMSHYGWVLGKVELIG